MVLVSSPPIVCRMVTPSVARRLGGDAQRVLAFLDQAALDAVGGIGELDAAVADRRAAVAVQQMRLLAHVLA